MMKKRILAVICASMLAVSGCAAPGAEDDTKNEETAPEAQQTEETQQENDEKDSKEQAKLDSISPMAYGNADGLALEKGNYISVIGKSVDGEYWEQIKKGVSRAADDINKNLGYEGKDKVKVTYNGPSEADDVDEQVNILDEELARYPVAVAIAIADAKACDVQFDIAAENSIPVVAFDSGSDYKGLQAMVSTDNEQTAKEVADHMAEQMEKKGEILVIAHDSKTEAATVRRKAFVKRMKEKHPDIKIAGVYALDSMKEKVAKAVNEGTYSLDGGDASDTAIFEGQADITPEDITNEVVLDYILEKHPQIDGIYGTNSESVLESVSALERKGMENVCVMGYDADDAEIEALKEGKIQGLLVQNPFGMGYASVIAAARASLKIGNEAYVDTGYVWVTKDNLDDVDIQKMLY